LTDAATAKKVSLDRWTIRFTDSSDLNITKSMLCFFSIGFDAKIAHKFHLLREASPSKTSSRAINKLWHTWYGVIEFFYPFAKVSTFLELVVDGEKIELPQDLRTLQVFNIHSSADGVDFFGTDQVSIYSNRLY
jgi:diacylglycerol kinase (ATP)